MAGRMLPLVVPRASSTSWGSVVAAAAGAGGRALVAGCGGHLLFRFVVHHLVPLLLRRLRRRRRRRQQPRPPLGPASARADTDGAGECEESESERAKKNAKVGGEEAEEEEEERDGPVTPLPPADNVDEAGGDGQVKPERCGMWWWLWDGSQNRESLRLGAFLASMTGGFRVVEFALQRLRGTDDGWNSFLAGTIAGLSIAFDTKERQKAVSLYVFFKACGMVWSSLSSFLARPDPNRGLAQLRPGPAGGGRWTAAQHGIWCLLCGVMMYCFFCEGELLDSFVYRFLYSCTSPHDQYAMSYVRKYALGMADEDPEAKAQERRDYASGKLRSVPPPVIVKRREHFARMRAMSAATTSTTCSPPTRSAERAE